MESDSVNYFFSDNVKPSIIKQLFLEELLILKKRLENPPHPFCELDCPWIMYCRQNLRLGCILSDMIEIGVWESTLHWSKI
ncbi:hypothetical protein [Candidatus Hodarchaeum mangrovi]